jgi:hypothetical protein
MVARAMQNGDELDQGSNAGLCLEFLLHHDKLAELTQGLAKMPDPIAVVILEGIAEMVKAVRHPLFWGSQAVQKPLEDLIKFFGDACRAEEALTRDDNLESALLMRLLAAVSEKLRMAEDELLVFFFDERPDAEEPCLVVRILLQYLQSGSAVSVSAKRSMLEFMQLRGVDATKFKECVARVD